MCVAYVKNTCKIISIGEPLVKGPLKDRYRYRNIMSDTVLGIAIEILCQTLYIIRVHLNYKVFQQLDAFPSSTTGGDLSLAH
jgi:hypothetical protein